MTELRDVFINLIQNAIDAMPTGGTLTFTAETVSEQVAVSVGDTGCGMPPQAIQRIADPFFTTKHDKGSGMGMYLVYGIIQRHGGLVEIESEPGKGTKVTVRLPVTGTREERPAVASADAVDPAGTRQETKTLRILIVDDEKAVREGYAKILRRLGQEVDTAMGGVEAIHMAERCSYDLVFTDLSMPEMSGWEVARLLHEKLPGTAITLMSGWGADFSTTRLASHGITHVLPKPATLRDLGGIVLRVQESRALLPDTTVGQ
jgi:CheY-like chemotaxis protein